MSDQNVIHQTVAVPSASNSSSVDSARTLLLQSTGAFVFGAAILLILGFAPMSPVHNAAHDTRHSVTFPCH